MIFFTSAIFSHVAYSKNLPDQVEQVPLPSLAPMLKRVTPCIVSITGIKKIQTVPYPVYPGQPDLPHKMGKPEEYVSTMIGSGVVVDSNKGYILTNAHVVLELEEITVTLYDQSKYSAKLVGQDKASDLALLKIDADNLVEIQFADSDAAEVGDFVVAIGSPYGFKHTVTSGIISAIGRNDIGVDGFFDFIQTDADINMGNSGGGLLNLKGELVGINTVIVSPGNNGGSIGLGFAIPSNMARGIFSQLANSGHVDRGPLGVRVQPLTPALSEAFKVQTNHGAVVIDVIPNTPAEKAGIQIGDVFLKVNNKVVKGSFHLRILISLIPAGSTIDVQLSRKGELLSLPVMLANPKDNYTPGKEVFPGLDGISLEELNNPQISGIRIAAIEKNSIASNLELMENDIILSANLHPIPTPTIDKLKHAAFKSKYFTTANSQR